MKKYLFESSFAGLTVKPIISAEKDKCLALASLTELQGFIPNVDIGKNLDLLPVAFNACVINRVNKNKDVVSTATAIEICKHFINKPINVEHNRKQVVGMILTAGFSEFGTDKILSEDEVKTMTEPFNITLGGVIWRVVCPELSDLIEEAADPTSEKYLSVSASWELGFSEYNVVLLEGGIKNLSEAKKIITDEKEISSIKDKLTSLGGAGKIEDLFAYRMPCNDVLPLGIGFTVKPAAEVKGIAVPIPEDAEIIPTVGVVNTNTFEETKTKYSTGAKENISQLDKNNVKTERHVTMKITSLQDITAENLKECTASVVSEFIASELTKSSSEWEKQKGALNLQLTEAQATSEKMKSTQAELESKLKTVEAQVQSLANEKLEREKVEKFNIRMASIAEQYELDDETRLVLSEEIKEITSDEAFTKWESRAKVLLKKFVKKKAKADDDGDDAMAKKTKVPKVSDDDDADDASGKKAKASEAIASVVSDAVDNGKVTGGIPNGTSAAETSLKEKYKEAFAKEGFVISR